MLKREFFIYYLLCISLLILNSCTNYSSSNVSQLLAQAELRMSDQPDSVYTLLNTIDIDRIPSGELRARYALLFTEALYKTYRHIENDSLINIALDYYTRKNIPFRKAYALFYQGFALSQINNIAESFQSFRLAQELAAEIKDDYLQGLTAINIAELYQNQYHFEQALELLRQALTAFQKADKEKHICYTLIVTGTLFLSINVDSSAHYFQAAKELAVQLQDVEYEYSALMNMYSVYVKQKEYERAGDLLFENIHRFNKDMDRESDILIQLSMLYYTVNQLDSAFYYVNLVALDSLDTQKKPGALLLLKLIEEKRGDHKAALEYHTQYKLISDEVLRQNQAEDISKAEERYNREKLKSENYALKNRVLSMIIGFLVVAILTLAAMQFLVRRLKRRSRFREERLKKMSILREDELIARSIMREKQLKQIVERRFSVIKGLLDLSYIKDPQSHLFVERFRAAMVLSGKPEETFFADLVPFMNDYYFGAVDWLKEHYSDLSDSDVELICLLFFKFTPQELCALYGLENIGAIYTRCSRVAKKLKLEKSVSIRRFLEKKIDELKTHKGM